MPSGLTRYSQRKSSTLKVAPFATKPEQGSTIDRASAKVRDCRLFISLGLD